MARELMDGVLVINVGSSSTDVSIVDGGDVTRKDSVATDDGVGGVLDRILGDDIEVRAIGHRLVHGGARHTTTTVIDDTVRQQLEEVVALAPIHVPAALRAVDEARALLPDVPHVACFDTTFHRHLPEDARTYALPAEWRERWELRRFGFHGLSYARALRRTGELLGRRPQGLQAVLVHLGGGASGCAVRDGHSVDTSMGLTPLEGMVMGTRSGSVDPGLLLWLLDEGGLTTEEVADGLWRGGGLAGLDGRTHTNDLVAARRDGDEAASVALAVFVRSIRQTIGSLATALDRLDAVVFTGEIGGDQPEIRRDVCAGLATLGVPAQLEPVVDVDAVVSAPSAAVPVVVVETREDLEIAREVQAALT